MPNLNTLIWGSEYDSFKNNNIYTGSFNISGTATAGVNTQTYDVALSVIPDITDIVFNGPADSGDPRPNGGWFHSGVIRVRGDDAPIYNNYSTLWKPYSSINGNIVTLSVYWVQQFTASLSLTSTTVSYRIIDYSVF